MSVMAAVRGQLGGYRRILRLRDYRLLWSAQVASTFGDRLTQIALTTLVFALSGSDIGIGIVLTLTVLPRAVFGLLAGAVADRVSRKSLLITTDLTRALIVLVLAVAADLPLSAIYLLAALQSTATVFFTPTRYAVLPDIVPQRHLLAANTLDETTQSTLDPVAFLVGGALVAGVGARLGFAIDAATFVLSAALITLTTARGAAQWHGRDTGRLTAGLTDGLRVLWRQPALRANTMLMLFAATIASAETPLTYMMVMTHWRTGPFGLGVLEAGLAVGFVVGALACESVVQRVGKGPTILIGLVGTGITMAAIALLPFWLAVAVNGVSGAFNILFFVPTLTLHQELAPPATRARVLASRGALMAVALFVSYALATGLTTLTAPGVVMGVMGLVLTGGALLAALVPELRRR
ncbi:MAG TPA: MFS transporter [Thermoleophilia bacterium]